MRDVAREVSVLRYGQHFKQVECALFALEMVVLVVLNPKEICILFFGKQEPTQHRWSIIVSTFCFHRNSDFQENCCQTFGNRWTIRRGHVVSVPLSGRHRIAIGLMTTRVSCSSQRRLDLVYRLIVDVNCYVTRYAVLIVGKMFRKEIEIGYLVSWSRKS